MSELDGWKHCPRCGAPLEPHEGRAECEACGATYYAGSKPTSSALVVDDEGRLLLSRRGIEPFKGKWDFPGGFTDEHEHPRDAVIRELEEEAGVRIEPLELIGVWIDEYGGDGSAVATINFYWTARLVEGNPEPADDVAELRWFAPADAMQADLAFGHLQDVLSAWEQHA